MGCLCGRWHTRSSTRGLCVLGFCVLVFFCSGRSWWNAGASLDVHPLHTVPLPSDLRATWCLPSLPGQDSCIEWNSSGNRAPPQEGRCQLLLCGSVSAPVDLAETVVLCGALQLRVGPALCTPPLGVVESLQGAQSLFYFSCMEVTVVGFVIQDLFWVSQH